MPPEAISSLVSRAAQSQPLGRAVGLRDQSAGWRRRQDLEHTPVRVGPADHGHDLTGRAAHTDRSLGERSISMRCPDRKSTRLNSSHGYISYAVFCLKKKKNVTPRRLDCFTRTV